MILHGHLFGFGVAFTDIFFIIFDWILLGIDEMFMSYLTLSRIFNAIIKCVSIDGLG